MNFYLWNFFTAGFYETNILKVVTSLCATAAVPPTHHRITEPSPRRRCRFVHHWRRAAVTECPAAATTVHRSPTTRRHPPPPPPPPPCPALSQVLFDLAWLASAGRMLEESMGTEGFAIYWVVVNGVNGLATSVALFALFVITRMETVGGWVRGWVGASRCIRPNLPPTTYHLPLPTHAPIPLQSREHRRRLQRSDPNLTHKPYP